ncbi:MAG TPA: hypothetical protein VHL08_00575 [Dongiaceae bacterium]|jgi:hypothetical protein|nr:hypothetical protein [Dongiaceae bacterium]
MFLERFKKPKSTKRVAEVGWIITQSHASMIWDDPKPFGRDIPKSAVAKSVQACPAALDFDSRHFVINCPVDLNLRFVVDQQQRPGLQNMAREESTIRPKYLNQMVVMLGPAEWRHPRRPIIQVITPYVFFADDPVYVNQIPPYLDYIDPPWPGVLISGRFPIHIWPRPFMWAFEWYDTKKDIVIKRGDPWFYARFEAEEPSRPVRLIEAEKTPELENYINSISGVTNYVNRTYSLFDLARKRRPKRLLVPRSRT